MKQYEKAKLIVCLLCQDVITVSTAMATYDDMASWKDGWSSGTGGNN